MRTPDIPQLLRRRESGAIEQLLTHYGPLMRYIIKPILSDERDREECLNDIAMKVWERIDSFDPCRGSFTTWLTAITRNAALNRLRSLREAQPLHEKMEAPHSDPEQILLRRERQRLLKQALDALPESEQQMFYRKYYYRQSTYQIATEMGLTERAVEGRLYRIKKRLQAMLGGEADA